VNGLGTDPQFVSNGADARTLFTHFSHAGDAILPLLPEELWGEVAAVLVEVLDVVGQAFLRAVIVSEGRLDTEVGAGAVAVAAVDDPAASCWASGLEAMRASTSAAFMPKPWGGRRG
jgi:hypothetical protein